MEFVEMDFSHLEILRISFQLPMSLMPLAEFEKMNVALFARRNSKELIGQKDDFRINTGIVHKSVCFYVFSKPFAQAYWSCIIS